MASTLKFILSVSHSRLSSFIFLSLFIYISQQVHGSRLQFDDDNRLARQHANVANNLIRPVECRNANNHSELGVCMFSIDCMHNKGVALSVCKHNYFVGTCCRLPEYNNFVGIVYDLRDTDTGYFLEARKVTPDGHRSTLPASSPTVTTNLLSSSTTNAPISSPQDETNQNKSTLMPSVIIRLNESTPKPEERYVISSSNLFAGPSPAPAKSKKTGDQSTESARNADGSASTVVQPLANVVGQPQQRVDVIESVAQNEQQPVMSVQLSPPNVLVDVLQNLTSTDRQQTAYDLIKEPSAQTDAISVMTSAHSPTTKRTSTDQLPTLATFTANSSFPSSQYPIETTAKMADNVEFPSTTPILQKPTNEPIPSIVSSPVQPNEQLSPLGSIFDNGASDQEFNLSITTRASDSRVDPVDLVSASNITTSKESQQTTTPFTTSLSTAQLPDVSSYQRHSLSPSALQPETSTSMTLATSKPDASTSQEPQNATSPPASLVQSSPVQQFVVSQLTSSAPNSSPATSSSSTTTSPTPNTINSTSSQTKPTHQHIAIANSAPPTRWDDTYQSASSFGYGQLYTSHHTYHMAGSTKPTQVITLSSQSVPASTKTVSPSHSSQSNNLIPNLSNLQSAILSHIPFKLATGLSSGLSSYLQAAMKPNTNRPLMASNTAPASQYQSGSNGSSSTSKPTIVQSDGSGSQIRFAGPSSSDTSSMTTTTIPQTAMPPIKASNIINWITGQQATSVAASQSSNRLKEAQMVCGRPLGGSPTSASPLAANHSPSGALSSNPEAKKRVARIVGGNQSSFGQWPWMVSLRQWRKGVFLHKCGAALLSEGWAITAAHCVDGVKPSDLLLRLGEFDVSNQNEPYPYIERKVKTVVSHPSFDSKTFEYDLALLKFVEPIKFEKNIIPVCIPTGNDSYVDRIATVIGWGRLYEDGPLPDIIQHVDVPIITNNECEKMYKNAGFVEEIPDIFICAGINKGGRDSCEGDSGGPLTMVDHDNRAYLVGIISWGIGCALPSQPGVYTRITTFSNWINDIIAFS